MGAASFALYITLGHFILRKSNLPVYDDYSLLSSAKLGAVVGSIMFPSLVVAMCVAFVVSRLIEDKWSYTAARKFRLLAALSAFLLCTVCLLGSGAIGSIIMNKKDEANFLDANHATRAMLVGMSIILTSVTILWIAFGLVCTGCIMACGCSLPGRVNTVKRTRRHRTLVNVTETGESLGDIEVPGQFAVDDETRESTGNTENLTWKDLLSLSNLSKLSSFLITAAIWGVDVARDDYREIATLLGLGA